eukprot:TRINITY_DN12370_c0_g1_i1.p1 TRINITY_DN12370_c0_g1~~TRINITY_DN12370_c0_g1_i1.p1  ORF type:complete len:308 (+),score=39.22 TRINITY_DN12370_c0_g1_i1:22-945(+)
MKPNLILLSLVVYLSLFNLYYSLGIDATNEEGKCSGSNENTPKHRVELYITALNNSDFLSSMQTVVMNIGSSINFSIDFIGSYSIQEHGSIHFSSPNGHSEIEGDKWMLCGISNLPENHQFIHFITCLATNSSSFSHVEYCLGVIKSKNIDKYNQIKHCYETGAADQLLKASMDRSKNLNITTSPTIILDGSIYSGHTDQQSMISAACNLKQDDEKYIGNLGIKYMTIVIFIVVCIVLVIILIVLAAYTFYKYWKAAPSRWLNMLKTRGVSDSLQFSHIQVDDPVEEASAFDSGETSSMLLETGPWD